MRRAVRKLQRSKKTCRRLDINLRAYLGEVLPKLGQWPINRVGELTPTAWKATQAKKS